MMSEQPEARMEQARKAEAFRRRHHEAPPPLLLANAWDALSARLFEDAGFEAVATTSGGLAWALGYRDGEQAPWDAVLEATARIARHIRVPLTADIEQGYAATAREVESHVTAMIEAGIHGLNLEDGLRNPDRPLRDPEDAAERIAAARQAAEATGIPIVINARIDAWSRRIGDDAACLEEALKRGPAYLAAGADCLYPIGLSDPSLIARLTRRLGCPLNIVGRAGGPGIETLADCGVSRISTATGPCLAAYGAARAALNRVRESGSFEALATDLNRAEVETLLGRNGDAS